MRPGIVHRLDKDTSGLMVLSKSEVAHEKLMLAFKEREVVRKYVALVDGVMQHNFGTIDAPVGRDASNRTRMKVINDGRSAKTFFTVLERANTQHLSKPNCTLEERIKFVFICNTLSTVLLVIQFIVRKHK